MASKSESEAYSQTNLTNCDFLHVTNLNMGRDTSRSVETYVFIIPFN